MVSSFLGGAGGNTCTGFVTLISVNANAKLPLSNQLPRTTPAEAGEPLDGSTDKDNIHRACCCSRKAPSLLSASPRYLVGEEFSHYLKQNKLKPVNEDFHIILKHIK